MKHISLVVIVLFFVIGCGDNLPTEETRIADIPYCEDHRTQLADFVLTCALNANPKSDEEGEDLVEQCEKTGLKVVCPSHRTIITQRCKNHSCEDVRFDPYTK